MTIGIKYAYAVLFLAIPTLFTFYYQLVECVR